MLSKKVLAVILTVALFTGAIVFGVHTMHRDALAFPTFTVNLHDIVFIRLTTKIFLSRLNSAETEILWQRD